MPENLVVFPFYVVGVIVVIILILKMYKKVPPNCMLIVYGLGLVDKKVCDSGGRFVLPFVQSYEYMPLSPINLDITLPESSNVLSKDSIKLAIIADATISISKDPAERITAARLFLGQNKEAIAKIAQETMIGATRDILNSMEFDKILGDREELVQLVKERIETTLSRFGLDLINYNFKEIKDSYGIVEQRGKKASAEAVRQATVSTANINKEQEILVTQANTEKQTQVAEKNKEKDVKISEIDAENATKTAEFNIEKARAQQKQIAEVTRAEQEAIKISETAKADSNKGIAIATSNAHKEAEITKQSNAQLIAESAKITLEKETEVQVAQKRKDEVVQTRIDAEKAIVLKENELKRASLQADNDLELAEKRAKAKIIEAEANKKASIMEAEGEAARIATPILERAKAEQEAKKIYGEEGMLKMALIKQLPEIARLQVEALASFKVEHINIIGGSNSENSGAAGNEIAKTATNIMNAAPLLGMINKMYSDAGIIIPGTTELVSKTEEKECVKK